MKILRNFIIICFVLFLFTSLIRNLFDYRDKLQFFQDYKNAFDTEQKENITLKTEILKKTSQSELEKTIRNKLNLLKPNEVAIMIPSPTPIPTTPTPIPLPIWEQWWKLFLK